MTGPVDHLQSDAEDRVNGRPRNAAKWPDPMRPEAFTGLAGEFVEMVAPHTEADPHGLLLQLLAAAGNAIGRNPGLMADGAFHATVIWPILLGATSKARKGTAWARVREAMELADPEWADGRIVGGLSSGEGLIYHVRDEVRERRKPRKGELPDDDGRVEDIADPGSPDKRLLVVETEFAMPFKAMAREGNTLSIALRTLWDNGRGGALTKRDHTTVTRGHVTVIGHVTVDELRTVVTDVDVAGGLVNRMLFCCVKRSQQLPRGGFVNRETMQDFASRLGAVMREAATLKGALDFTDEGGELWDREYARLTADRAGRLGAATNRAEAQVLRLALLYAVLDERSVIDVEHLQAALAVWDYCAASAAYLFGDSTGDKHADKILQALRRRPKDGMTRTDIRPVVGGDVTEERLVLALDILARHNLAGVVTENDTGGRPAERWYATGPTSPKERR